MITLANYSSSWTDFYENESISLKNRLGEYCINTYHIGSTAISNMPAKPIVDIILEIRDMRELRKIESMLVPNGYQPFSRNIIPMHSAITHKSCEKISFNIHIFEENDPQIERHLNFCSYLSQDEYSANEYKELKNKLAKKYQNDPFNYTLHKGDLIHKIDALAKVKLTTTHKNINLLLKSSVNPLSEADLIKSAKLNLYLLLTQYAQYIPEVKFFRMPGYTLINSGIQEVGYNHVLDIHFPPDTVDKRIQDLISQCELDNIPYQWWLELCDNEDKMNELIRPMSNINIFPVSRINSLERSVDSFTEYEIRQLTDKCEILTYRGINARYLEMLSKIPHSNLDPIQHYELIYQGKVIGNFTLVFYAKIIGIYWLNIPNKNALQAMIQKTVELNKQLNYSGIVIFNDNTQPLLQFHSLVTGK